MSDQAFCNCLGCQAHTQIMTFQNLAYERQKEIERLREVQLDIKKEDPDGYGFQMQRGYSIDPEESVESNVFMALGAASMCWENISAAGVFESTRCAETGATLMEYLRKNKDKL